MPSLVLDEWLGSAVGLRLRVGWKLQRRNLFNQAFGWFKSPEKDSDLRFLRALRAACDWTAQTSVTLNSCDFRV